MVGSGYDGCMFDTAGSRLNFPVVAGVEETFRLVFLTGTEAMSVLGATFQAACCRAHGDAAGELVAVLPVEHGGKENTVMLTVPELELGHYFWELRATDAAGKECRLLYGTLTALSSAQVTRIADAADESAFRELHIQIGDDYAAPLVLRWQGSSLVAGFAEDAARAAREANEAVKRLEDVEVAVQEYRVFMAQWKDEAASLLVMNPVTGTIWVGNTDTGQPYQGADGRAPRINAYGYWETFENGRWNTLPYCAIGKDGMDGSKVVRVRLNSVDELPLSGETCNGGYLYYVPTGRELVTRRMGSASPGVGHQPATARELVFSAARCWSAEGGVLKRLGVQAESEMNGEPSAELLYAHVFFEEDGGWWYAGRSSNAVAQVAGAVSWWEFDSLEVSRYCRVKVVFSQGENEPVADIEAVRVRSYATSDGSQLVTDVGTIDFVADAFWEVEREGFVNWQMYAWLEGAGWVCVGERYDLATADAYGLMKYATDVPVVDGAPVGQDAAGHARVPLASSTVPGAIRPSSGEVSDVGGGTHVSVTGTLLTDVATPGRFGSVKLGTSNVITSGALVGVNANGQLMVPMATLGTAGVFRLGTQYPTDPGDGYRVGVGAYNNQLCIAFVPGGALRHWRPATWAGSGMDWIRDVSWSSEDSYFTCLLTTDQFGQDGERGLSLKTATTERLAGVFLASGEEDVRGNAVPSMGQVNKRFAPRDSVYDREEAERRFLMKSDTVDEIRQLTLSEYQALRARNPKCLYLVTED